MSNNLTIKRRHFSEDAVREHQGNDLRSCRIQGYRRASAGIAPPDHRQLAFAAAKCQLESNRREQPGYGTSLIPCADPGSLGRSTCGRCTDSPPTDTARARKSMTAFAKMSLRSPATMWAASATQTYSLCGHKLRKSCAPDSLRTSERPPRTSSVGSFSRDAQLLKRGLKEANGTV